MLRYEKYTALVAAAAFVLSALLCGLLSALTVSPVFHVPVIREPFSSTGNFLSDAALISFGSVTCAAMIYLSGFTVFTRPVCAAVMLWRGACLGYSLSSAKTGSLILLREKKLIGIPSSVLIPAFFILSALILIAHSSLAASFSVRSRNGKPFAGEALKFSAVSLVICGALIVLDVMRCFMI